MKKYFLLAVCFIAFSCDINKENNKDSNDNLAIKALEEGYVFVDGSNKVVHWNKSCNRAVQKIMILRSIEDLHPDAEFCSCMPVDKMKEILNKR